jgi:hypothetical protein
MLNKMRHDPTKLFTLTIGSPGTELCTPAKRYDVTNTRLERLNTFNHIVTHGFVSAIMGTSVSTKCLKTHRLCS